MKYIIKCILCCCLFFILILNYSNAGAQVLSGIVNTYLKVDSVLNCAQKIKASNTTGFAIGDRVMLIQMQGASINTNNNILYGTVSNLGSCGNYEIFTVSNVTANAIFFTTTINRAYDVSKKVQLVKIATCANGSIAVSGVTGQPWNGTTGGIIAIEATGILTLNGNIDASGIGFRGGVPNTTGFPWSNIYCGFADYYTNSTSGLGAGKGEGISDFILNQEYGRGCQANGGGGGNSVNAGGGGGANYGFGGIGGDEVALCAAPLTGGQPGFGLLLNYTNAINKVFMGGGGGAGQQDASLQATAGGNGGGIVFIRANNITASGGTILANGQSQTIVAGLDGGGGGGGGGAVLLDVGTFTSFLNIVANGGSGGDVNGPNPTCWGPGGGGGGGVIWKSGTGSFPANVFASTNMGFSGTQTNSNSVCFMQNIGAQNGQMGAVLTGLQFNTTSSLFAGNDTSVCLGKPCTLHATGSSSGYTWSPASAFVNPNIANAILVNPTTSTTYVVTGTNSFGCPAKDTIMVNVTPGLTAIVSGSITICAGSSVALSAGGGTVYKWYPSTALSATNLSSVTASPSVTTTYYVVVTNPAGVCGTADTGSVVVYVDGSTLVDAGPDLYLSLNASASINATCNNPSSSNTYTWYPATGLDNAYTLNPTVTAQGEYKYTITVTTPNGCTASDTMHVYLVDAILVLPSAFSPNDDGKNDVFKILNTKFTGTIDFRIYDRWGNQVFHTNDVKEGWNGFYLNKPAPNEVYAYYIKYTVGSDSKEYIKQGNVTLMR